MKLGVVSGIRESIFPPWKPLQRRGPPAQMACHSANLARAACCISEMLSTIWPHGALVAAAVCVLSSRSKGGLDTSMLIKNIDTAGASLEAR